MAVSIVMPALEMAQETGKIISWLKKEGDSIAKGEPIAEIETDKVVLELEAPADGVLAGVRAAAGDVVQVGKTIAWIVAPGEKPPVEDGIRGAGRAHDDRAIATGRGPVSSRSRPARRKVEAKVSPKARRMAQELGVDLSQVVGTGPGGVISGEDVQRAAESQKTAPSRQPFPHLPAPRLELHRSPDGRAHHAKLDHRAAFLPGPRNRRQRVDRGARKTWQGDYSHRSSGRDWSRAHSRSIPR